MNVNEEVIDDTVQGLVKWLQSEHNYVVYNTRFDFPYTFKTEMSKRVVSDAVCECNDKLSIYISVAQLSINDSQLYNNTDISITAERKGKWWILKCYSLNIKEVYDGLEEIEKDLIKLFNTL